MNGEQSDKPPKLRVVLDTNVIISAVCFPASLPRYIFQAVGEQHTLLFSEALMDEVEEVLLRDKFDRFLSRRKRIETLIELNTVAVFLPITSAPRVIRDESDNAVLAVAIDGQADYLVTGNTQHFMVPDVQAAYPDIVICTPRAFFDAVAAT